MCTSIYRKAILGPSYSDCGLQKRSQVNGGDWSVEERTWVRMVISRLYCLELKETKHFSTNLRDTNKQVMRTPFPIPKIEYCPTMIAGVHIWLSIRPQYGAIYKPLGSRCATYMHNTSSHGEIVISLFVHRYSRRPYNFLDKLHYWFNGGTWVRMYLYWWSTCYHEWFILTTTHKH